MLVLKSMTAEQWAIAKKAISDAGHTLEHDTISNVHTFVAKLEASFPAVYAAIKQGIADVKDHSLSGGDKAVKVATDVLAIAPAVLTNLPGIKDALVAGVTALFAAEVSDFKSVAAETIQAL